MQQKKLCFKSRMSNADWELLTRSVQSEYPNLSDNAFIFNQITTFCKTVALPILNRAGHSRATSTVERTIFVPERSFDGTTNLQILEDFARFKRKTTTKIIQRYILDARIREEELKLVAKILAR